MPQPTPTDTPALNVLFLVSANNGLTQRCALAVERAGHRVRTVIVSCTSDMDAAVAGHDIDLIICPYLTRKIPAHIHTAWPTVIVHPGPPGDRGPSSLDWALTDDTRVWGVTALSAVDDMDAGPVWAYRIIDIPAAATKSEVYGGPITDAAVACVLETLTHARESGFAPTPQHRIGHPVIDARARPRMREADRTIAWSQDAPAIARTIRASDGAPGAAAELAGHPLYLHDAHPDALAVTDAAPGTVIGRRHHRIEIACGHGSVWVGALRLRTSTPTPKQPALDALASIGMDTDTIAARPHCPHHEIRYHQRGGIGTITIDFLNGAMSTPQCQRLLAALEFAIHQPTRVLVVRGNPARAHFANGIHLGVIEAAADPATTAWINLLAINDVCRTILTCTTQVTITALTGSVGAGGAMMALAADLVLAHDGIVINPHYATMGLHGSELHTYTLPRRVGPHTATHLLERCRAIDVTTAHELGIIDHAAPREQLDALVDDIAARHTDPAQWAALTTAKTRRLTADEARKPLRTYESAELARMNDDIFHDRGQFAARRHAFITKPASTPPPAHTSPTSTTPPSHPPQT